MTKSYAKNGHYEIKRQIDKREKMRKGLIRDFKEVLKLFKK